jgi:UDP-perosamine 4-acetyltransferase
MKGVIVIGAGGHAKVIIETLRAAGKVPDYCVANEAGSCLGVPVLSGDHHLENLRGEGYKQAMIAIGTNNIRAELAEKVIMAGFELISAVSPHAIISPSAQLGIGVAVMPGAIINADVVIEDLAIINTGAVVEHDCRVGYGAHVGPLCGLAGNVTIGLGAFLGVGVKVIPGITIGENTLVGAGAVVIADLPENVVAVGVPAEILETEAEPET